MTGASVQIQYFIRYTHVKAMMMRVRVDHELCEANAVCVRLVPEVFDLDDDDRLRLSQEQPDEALRSRVAEAVRRCPKQALSIIEEGGTS